MFDKGQSKRIWGELYKVVDSSDVVVQVSCGFLFMPILHINNTLFVGYKSITMYLFH